MSENENAILELFPVLQLLLELEPDLGDGGKGGVDLRHVLERHELGLVEAEAVLEIGFLGLVVEVKDDGLNLL